MVQKIGLVFLAIVISDCRGPRAAAPQLCSRIQTDDVAPACFEFTSDGSVVGWFRGGDVFLGQTAHLDAAGLVKFEGVGLPVFRMVARTTSAMTIGICGSIADCRDGKYLREQRYSCVADTSFSAQNACTFR